MVYGFGFAALVNGSKDEDCGALPGLGETCGGSMSVTPVQMVKMLEEALEANPLVAQVTVDGQTVRYDRAGALKELEYWRTKLATEAGTGTRLRFRGVNIGGSW